MSGQRAAGSGARAAGSGQRAAGSEQRAAASSQQPAASSSQQPSSQSGPAEARASSPLPACRRGPARWAFLGPGGACWRVHPSAAATPAAARLAGAPLPEPQAASKRAPSPANRRRVARPVWGQLGASALRPRRPSPRGRIAAPQLGQLIGCPCSARWGLLPAAAALLYDSTLHWQSSFFSVCVLSR